MQTWLHEAGLFLRGILQSIYQRMLPYMYLCRFNVSLKPPSISFYFENAWNERSDECLVSEHTERRCNHLVEVKASCSFMCFSE